MTLLLISFLAGILTVLAPCVLPLLPVVIGSSLSDGKNNKAPLIVVLSLGVSVFVFTILLKFVTTFIFIPQSFWVIFSGVIMIFVGVTMLFPTIWARLTGKLGAEHQANSWLGKAMKLEGNKKHILIGAALGPVFSTCSPTYLVILSAILPESLATGLVYMLAYVVGLVLVMLAVAYLGKGVMKYLMKASDPKGWLKKTIGVLFLLLGLGLMTGYDKKLETLLIDVGWGGLVNFEQDLLDQALE